MFRSYLENLLEDYQIHSQIDNDWENFNFSLPAVELNVSVIEENILKSLEEVLPDGNSSSYHDDQGIESNMISPSNG